VLAVRLDQATEERLAHLAQTTGRPKSFYVREALHSYLEDLEDIYLAEKALEDLRAGRSRTYTLEEIERDIDLAD